MKESDPPPEKRFLRRCPSPEHRTSDSTRGVRWGGLLVTKDTNLPRVRGQDSS